MNIDWLTGAKQFVFSERLGICMIGCLLLSLIAETVPCQESVSDQDPGAKWQQSYAAGYRDAQGHYAGGSEIMHLVSHRGQLFAANGYWVDRHWEIPPQDQRQSAQVLRLDRPGGQWQVDLEMGAVPTPSIQYMKGNILRSISISQTAEGRQLALPKQLLVAAAGCNFPRGGGVSAWVRDDTAGRWHHSLVRHGSALGGVRWVPRDIEVYQDKVTHQERIFLLLGNPGIISGQYDPEAPGLIRWSRDVEFPFMEAGSLPTRPLGIVEANGTLLFSAGDRMYRRIDGSTPRYEEILDLAADADPDSGGIRGITTVSCPKDRTLESILFLWSPGGAGDGQVYRLDPNSEGGYDLHKEQNLASLVSQTLGLKASHILGAHNQMYLVADPMTNEPAHLIGLQTHVPKGHGLRWTGSAYYGGALFAIRTEQAEYRIGEVNGRYAAGKPVLIAPRTFCDSPFSEDAIYVGGHDANGRISSDRAWVYKAPRAVMLGHVNADSVTKERAFPEPEASLTDGPVWELRIYQAAKDRYRDLLDRFQRHTNELFGLHGLERQGYWIPRAEGKRARTFVYLLKHPSRHEAWKNWKHFLGDRRWELVLRQPRFQRLLAGKPTSIFLNERSVEPIGDSAAKVSEPGLYEIAVLYTGLDDANRLKSQVMEACRESPRLHWEGQLTVWQGVDASSGRAVVVGLLRHGVPPKTHRFTLDASRFSNTIGEPIQFWLDPTDYSPMQ